MTQPDFDQIAAELVGDLVLCSGENGNPEHYCQAADNIRVALIAAWNDALEDVASIAMTWGGDWSRNGDLSPADQTYWQGRVNAAEEIASVARARKVTDSERTHSALAGIVGKRLTYQQPR